MAKFAGVIVRSIVGPKLTQALTVCIIAILECAMHWVHPGAVISLSTIRDSVVREAVADTRSRELDVQERRPTKDKASAKARDRRKTK